MLGKGIIRKFLDNIFLGWFMDNLTLLMFRETLTKYSPVVKKYFDNILKICNNLLRSTESGKLNVYYFLNAEKLILIVSTKVILGHILKELC